MIETAMAVLAFGIACGTLMYNVHEFRHISRDFRKGMEAHDRRMARQHERMIRVLERIEKRLR